MYAKIIDSLLISKSQKENQSNTTKMIPADSEIDEKTRFINLISRKKKITNSRNQYKHYLLFQ